jgi:hypothetical protein
MRGKFAHIERLSKFGQKYSLYIVFSVSKKFLVVRTISGVKGFGLVKFKSRIPVKEMVVNLPKILKMTK